MSNMGKPWWGKTHLRRAHSSSKRSKSRQELWNLLTGPNTSAFLDNQTLTFRIIIMVFGTYFGTAFLCHLAGKSCMAHFGRTSKLHIFDDSDDCSPTYCDFSCLVLTEEAPIVKSFYWQRILEKSVSAFILTQSIKTHFVCCSSSVWIPQRHKAEHFISYLAP